jgi:hypothetical protein
MSKNGVVSANLATLFQSASNPDLDKAPTPFSLRLTREERAQLNARAGAQPLGAFIREQLLGDNVKKRRKSRKPRVGDQKLSFVLSLLGEQRIASNLNQLARHANMGTLDFDDDVLEEIQEACAAMIAIRNFLLDSNS